MCIRSRIDRPFARLLAIATLAVMAWGTAFVPGAIAATPSPEADEAPTLAYTAWRLASLQTAGNPLAEPEAGETFSLAFGEGGHVTVTTDCAVANGTLAIEADGTVVPGVSISGENTCKRQSLPERFVNLVNLATAWTFEDDGMLALTLMDGGSIRLAQEIVGTTWRWTGFQGGDDATVTPEASEVAVTLTFREDGTAHVASGCASADLPYTLEGASGLAIDADGLEASCPDGSAAARLMRDLAFMRSYVFREGRLFVSLLADGGIHAFVASAPEG
ncbi:MAG: META domain-containing protein [Thermomicrobiales bacterium]